MVFTHRSASKGKESVHAVPDDKSRLFMSRADVLKKKAKQKEIDDKVASERDRLEKEANLAGGKPEVERLKSKVKDG